MKTIVDMNDACHTALLFAITCPEFAQVWGATRYLSRMTQPGELQARRAAASVDPFRKKWQMACVPQNVSLREWFGDHQKKSERDIREAVARGETLYCWRPRDAAGEMIHEQEAMLVVDWLGGLPESDPDPRISQKLWKLTWAAALQRANDWHDRMARAVDADARNTGDPNAVETMREWDTGYRMVRLLTLEALDYEGAMMGHCVGKGNYDDALIWSLRNPANEPCATIEAEESWVVRSVNIFEDPYLTPWPDPDADVRPMDGYCITQISGPGNRDVGFAYWDMVLEFLRHQPILTVSNANSIGCRWVGGVGGKLKKWDDMTREATKEVHDPFGPEARAA